MDELEIIWLRIERWLAGNAIDYLDTLAPGATEKELQEVEAVLGISLPDDYRKSCLIHNGQSFGASYYPLFPGNSGGELLSLEVVKQEYFSWKNAIDLDQGNVGKPLGPAKPFWWSPQWIPVTGYDGNNTCLDLDPESDGNFGQVLTVLRDSPTREVIAHSFTDFLWQTAEDMESGLIELHTYRTGMKGLRYIDE